MVAQARRLIARALEDEQDVRPDTLCVSIITHQQNRNYAAYRSHRRRRRRKGQVLLGCLLSPKSRSKQKVPLTLTLNCASSVHNYLLQSQVGTYFGIGGLRGRSAG